MIVTGGLFVNRNLFDYLNIRLKELKSFQEKIQYEIKVTTCQIEEMKERIKKEENIKAHLENEKRLEKGKE